MKSINARKAMIGLFKRNRTTRLRAIRVYLLIILGCTLLLFCFSVISLNEQREKAQELSTSNLRLRGEQLALDLERRMEILAASCLSRQNMQRIPYVPGQKQSVENLREYRDQFKILEKIHPIARHFFILDQNRLVFPSISSPPRQTLTSFIAADHSPNFKKYLKLFAEAENEELHMGQSAGAAQTYRSAEKLEVNARLKALARFRTARALQNANRLTDAIGVYQTLVKLYGDQYDEFQTPYILSLAAAPEELTRKIFSPAPQQPLYEIYQNLIGGRWELSADQTEYYMATLEQRLKLSPGARQVSDFLDHFQLAQAVSRESALRQPHAPFEMARLSFSHANRPYQTYQISIPGNNGRAFTVGFSVSMPWVIDSLLPTCVEESRYGNVGAISLVEYTEPRFHEASGKDIYVTFRSIFPLWKLHISTEAVRLSEMAASRELWFVGLSALMFLCILGLGLFLYIRVSWDIRWFQLRSDFVSGVSHEFKTPLSLIRLYSETLANDDQDYSPEDRRNYIRIIARESERMSRLIDNVLDFSKMEKGRNRHNLFEGDLAATISEAVSDYSEYLTWRGFLVKSSFWPNLPPVRFSPEQVSQMILNLLDNARKYSGSSRLIRVNVWVEDREVIVEVHDNGLGIPAEERDKIFQPFYRVSKGGEKGGCGLGLYLVDQVMKEHGGRVEVESQVNQGSRFRLIFPISGSKQVRSRKQKGRIFTNVQSEGQVQNLS
jgi:signal transduction histidine kinase/tetratricopeptide (TPR) repeat protein